MPRRELFLEGEKKESRNVIVKVSEKHHTEQILFHTTDKLTMTVISSRIDDTPLSLALLLAKGSSK